MRAGHRLARTVVLRLRFADYTRATRSRSVPHATASGAALAATATALLDEAAGLVRERGLTLVGVSLTNLEPADHWQPTLDLDGPDASGLDAAVDAVAERFGSGAVVRGALLRHGTGLEMPSLPDPGP
jgi:DNA polymerase-4